MRVKLRLAAANRRTFFVPHAELARGVTALVYRAVAAADPDMAAWLHDDGWQAEGTPRFKLFSYSRLFGKNRLVNEQGVFFGDPRVHLYFSSPYRNVVAAFAAGAMTAGQLDLAGRTLVVEGVDQVPGPDFAGGALDTATLSPLVISDSRTARSGAHRFLVVGEKPELALRRLVENARLKWLCARKDPKAFSLRLSLIGARRRPVYHAGAGYLFPASEAELRLEGPPEVLAFVYDAGLGERTGMGFGCLGVLRGGAAA